MATRNTGTSQALSRQSAAPSGTSVQKSRQLVSPYPLPPLHPPLLPSSILTTSQAQLHSQLAQLSANLSDTENLLRMTSVQAEAMRGLGSWHGGLFMAASKVLGEESVKEAGR